MQNITGLFGVVSRDADAEVSPPFGRDYYYGSAQIAMGGSAYHALRIKMDLSTAARTANETRIASTSVYVCITY
jgi:hypothetical protein